MTLTETVICLVIIVCVTGLTYPAIKPVKTVIDSQVKVISTLQEISKNRQKSIDKGGEPVKMGDVTYWPTRCTPHVFTTKRLKIQLSDYYFIEVKPNENTR